MASGVAVDDECKTIFEDIRIAKKHRYAIFHIKDEKKIVVECIGDRDATYDDFLDKIRNAEDNNKVDCRYGLFDFEYTHQHQGTTDVSKKAKLLLMLWCPDNAVVKKKMLYSSSFDAIKKTFHGVHKCIQATDDSEACYNVVEEKLRSGDRT